jgi:hypothetical protein
MPRTSKVPFTCNNCGLQIVAGQAAYYLISQDNRIEPVHCECPPLAQLVSLLKELEKNEKSNTSV